MKVYSNTLLRIRIKLTRIRVRLLTLFTMMRIRILDPAPYQSEENL
jgi:hypothetical protein